MPASWTTMTATRASWDNGDRSLGRGDYPGGGDGRPARAGAAASLARAAEAERSERLGGGRVTRGRVGGVVADQQATRHGPDSMRQVVADQVGAARPGHRVEQDESIVEALAGGRAPVDSVAGPDVVGPLRQPPPGWPRPAPRRRAPAHRVRVADRPPPRPGRSSALLIGAVYCPCRGRPRSRRTDGPGRGRTGGNADNESQPSPAGPAIRC